MSVKIKNNARRVNQQIAKVQLEGMENAIRYLFRQIKRRLSEPYSLLTSEVSRNQKSGIVGFDEAGHYSEKRYQKRALIVLTMFGKIRGIVRAYRRKIKK